MRTIVVAAMGLVALASLSASRPRVESDIHSENDGRVSERLAALERVVLKDPYHPDRTVLSRLDEVEEDIEAIRERGEETVRRDTRDDASLRKVLADLQKQADQIQRQLKSNEESLRRRSDDDADQLGELCRSVAQLARRVEELERRVRRLEAAK